MATPVTDTPGTKWLEEHGVAFERVPVPPSVVETEAATLAGAMAAHLGVPADHVLKTMVFDVDADKPCLVVMHGDRRIDLKALAAAAGCPRNKVHMASQELATHYTGYVFGGTGPFGTLEPLRVFVEQSIASLPEVYVNAGSRYLIVKMSTEAFLSALKPTLVDVARK
eukprot:m51a1_g464 hypothetical protein (168) ;mRNA; f:175170-175753